jgi:hypothetical protein
VIERVTPTRLLPLRLLGVEAQHVAQPPLSVSDHHLLDLQPLVDHAVAAGAREHLSGQRVGAELRHAHEVLAPGQAERGRAVRLTHRRCVLDAGPAGKRRAMDGKFTQGAVA